MVIAIIAILAAILFPVFAQARDKARQANCMSALKQINLALIMYRLMRRSAHPLLGVRGAFRSQGPVSHLEGRARAVHEAGSSRCPSNPQNRVPSEDIDKNIVCSYAATG